MSGFRWWTNVYGTGRATAAAPGQSHEPPLTSSSFRSGRCTVILYDDDLREVTRFERCSELIEASYDLRFRDEFGLRRHICGFGYSVEEEI